MRIGLGLCGVAALLAAFALAAPAPAQDWRDALDERLKELADSFDELRRKTEQRDAAERVRRRKEGTRGAWAVSPDGVLVAAGTPEGKVELWKSGEARPYLVLEGHSDLVTAVAFGPGPTSLATVGQDGVARIWDLAKGAKLEEFGKPGETIELGGSKIPVGYRGVVASPDRRMLAFPTVMSIQVLEGPKGRWRDAEPFSMSSGASFVGDSRRLLVTRVDRVEVRDLLAAPKYAARPLWRLRTKRGLGSSGNETPELGDVLVVEAVALPAENLVVTSDLAGLDRGAKPLLRGWNAATGKLRWEKPAATDDVRLSEAPVAKFVVVRTQAALLLHSPRDGTIVRSIPLEAGKPRPAVFAPDASFGYTADRDGNLIRIPVLATPTPAPAPAPPVPVPPPAPGTGK